MDQRHEEYAAYYAARAARYAARPLYAETARAEAAMAESIATASTLEEWGAEMQRRNLNVACAVALARDQARAEAGLYDSIAEPVRASGPKRVLAELTTADGLSAVDVAAKASAIANDTSKAIAVDELVTVFHGALDILEELEIYATAEMPDEWRAHWKRVADDDIARGRTNWREVTVPNHQMWDPAWRFDETKIWETRFRRRIPGPDDVVRRRLEQFRDYRGEQA